MEDVFEAFQYDLVFKLNYAMHEFDRLDEFEKNLGESITRTVERIISRK